MSSQRDFGALRVAAHQRQHRVDAVEQEMRPDARLQRLQPRLGDGRRQRAGAQMEIEQQDADREQAEQDPARQRARRHGRAAGPASRTGADPARTVTAATTPAPTPNGSRDSRGRQRPQHGEHEQKVRLDDARSPRPIRRSTRGELRGTRERDDGRAEVDRHEDAQDGPQVAEVGQRGPIRVMSYNRCHIGGGMQASCPPPCSRRRVRTARFPSEGRPPGTGTRKLPGIHCRHGVRPTQDITSLGHVRRQRRLLLPPPIAAGGLVRTVQRAGGRPRQALHRIGRLRPAAGAKPTSPDRSPTPGCWRPPESSRRATWPTSSAASRRSARRSRAANSRGRSTSRTSISTSKGG